MTFRNISHDPFLEAAINQAEYEEAVYEKVQAQLREAAEQANANHNGTLFAELTRAADLLEGPALQPEMSRIVGQAFWLGFNAGGDDAFNAISAEQYGKVSLPIPEFLQLVDKAKAAVETNRVRVQSNPDGLDAALNQESIRQAYSELREQAIKAAHA